MKAAQVSDVWRRLFRRPFEVSYDKLVFKGVQRIGTATIDFKPGITAVVGGNGVGKSTLMSTIVRSLGPAGNVHAATLFEGEDIEVAGTLKGKPDNRIISTSMQGDAINVVPADAEVPEYRSIDPSTYATKVQRLILEDAEFSDNLEGIDPEKYSTEECNTMSYIVGKKYDNVEVYEIDYAELGTIPYFRVQSDEIEYDSAQMGLGELSLFLIYWQLRGVQQDSIVLVEEPETHVSPRSQESLINVCAKMSVQKGLHLIVTTHSPFIIWNLPRDHVRLLMRDGVNVGVVASPSHDQVARVLGDRLNYHGALLVEDALSRAVVRGILRVLAPELLEYYEVVNAESTDGVKQCIEKFPRLKDWCSLVGMFDGDQRELILEEFRWPHVFLPGNRSPENALKEIIEQRRVNVAAKLGCTVEQLNVACEAALGLESHEWLRRVRQALALELSTFVDGIIQVWLADEENRTSCEPFVAVLQDKAFLIKRPD